MKRPTRLLEVLFPLALGACASFSGGPPPLRNKTPLPMEFRGEIGLLSQVEDPPPRAEPMPASALKMDGPAVEIRADLYRVDQASLQALLDLPALRPAAFQVNLEEAAKALQELQDKGLAKSLSSPRLVSWSRQRARVSLSDKVSYIEGFKLNPGKKGMILDPQVGVFQAETQVTVTARAGKEGDQVNLEVQIHLRKPPGKLPVLEMKLASFPRPLSLQAPLVFLQDLSARASLTPSQGLLLAGLEGGRQGRAFLALVHARKLNAPR